MWVASWLGGQHCPFRQELISGHFGEDGASYTEEIQQLARLRQVGVTGQGGPGSRGLCEWGLLPAGRTDPEPG